MSGTEPQPRRALTGRALVLGTLVVLLVVVLGSPVNRYFGTRNDVGRTAEQLRTDQQELAELRKQVERWSDPGYIQQQARTRLQYAMPGDVVYVVVRPGQESKIETTSGTDGGSGGPGGPTWNQRLWHSVQVAGDAR